MPWYNEAATFFGGVPVHPSYKGSGTDMYVDMPENLDSMLLAPIEKAYKYAQAVDTNTFQITSYAFTNHSYYQGSYQAILKCIAAWQQVSLFADQVLKIPGVNMNIIGAKDLAKDYMDISFGRQKLWGDVWLSLHADEKSHPPGQMVPGPAYPPPSPPSPHYQWR